MLTGCCRCRGIVGRYGGVEGHLRGIGGCVGGVLHFGSIENMLHGCVQQLPQHLLHGVPRWLSQELGMVISNVTTLSTTSYSAGTHSAV